MPETATCAHHWILGNSVDGEALGVCRICGERRTFSDGRRLAGPIPRSGWRRNPGGARGYIFRDPELLRARSVEYQRRRNEFISAYLAAGSVLGAANRCQIPEASMRRCLLRWRVIGKGAHDAERDVNTPPDEGAAVVVTYAGVLTAIATTEMISECLSAFAAGMGAPCAN